MTSLGFITDIRPERAFALVLVWKISGKCYLV